MTEDREAAILEAATDRAAASKFLTTDVHAIFMDCLFNADEIETVDGVQQPKNPDAIVKVSGIMRGIGFNRDRLESHRDEIAAMMDDLPTEFMSTDEGGGGGYTFLNLCNDRWNNQWTGLHRTMEEFVNLCVALRHAQFTVPRALWQLLPGGVPYITFWKTAMTPEVAAAKQAGLDKIQAAAVAGDREAVVDAITEALSPAQQSEIRAENEAETDRHLAAEAANIEAHNRKRMEAENSTQT